MLGRDQRINKSISFWKKKKHNSIKVRQNEEKPQNEEEKGRQSTSFNITIGQTHFGLVNLSIDNHYLGNFFSKKSWIRRASKKLKRKINDDNHCQRL